MPAALAALAIALLAPTATAQRSDGGAARAKRISEIARSTVEPQPIGWEVFITPNLWAAGLHGEVGSRGRTVQVDLGFSDVVRNLDGALFLPLELRKGHWGLISELILIRLSNHSATPGPLFGGAELSVDETLFSRSTGSFHKTPSPSTCWWAGASGNSAP